MKRILSFAIITGSLVVLSNATSGAVLPSDAYIAHITNSAGDLSGGDTGVLLTIGALGPQPPGLPVPPLIFDQLELTPADDGLTFTKTAADPGFAGFAALLTNGVSDFYGFQILGNNTGSGGGGGETEESWFTSSTGAPFPFVTDFHGQQIGAISLVVNSVVADQANNNYSVDAYLAVQVPEPSALILAALGGLALLVWRRRDP